MGSTQLGDTLPNKENSSSLANRTMTKQQIKERMSAIKRMEKRMTNWFILMHLDYSLSKSQWSTTWETLHNESFPLISLKIEQLFLGCNGLNVASNLILISYQRIISECISKTKLFVSSKTPPKDSNSPTSPPSKPSKLLTSSKTITHRISTKPSANTTPILVPSHSPFSPSAANSTKPNLYNCGNSPKWDIPTTDTSQSPISRNNPSNSKRSKTLMHKQP